jgi:glutamyl-tRNA reductase
VRHLFRVTSSLDSLLIGEDQILAQVRTGFRESNALGLSGRLLGPIFEHSFQVGKQVRSETELGRHPLSIVGVGMSLVAERFADRTPRLAIIGAGSTGALAARTATDAGLDVALVVNRSVDKASAVAAQCGARALSLEEFRRAPQHVDALVSATSSSSFVLDREVLLAMASGGPLLGLDLAVPRDLEPVDDERVELIGIDQLRAQAEDNQRKRRAAVADAEALIEAKLATLARRFSERRLSSVLADLREESTDILERELSHLSDGRLSELNDEERRAVERWARGAFGRMSHVPITALKRLADEIAGETH